MSKHSKIGASSFHRWKMCPGSVSLSESVPPQPSSSYALEGTKAHEVAAYYLEHLSWPKDVDHEMLEAVSIYTTTVLSDAGLQNDYKVEVGFSLDSVHPGLFGTADCVMYDEANKLVRVYDYKHGKGISVDVEDNDQLKYYALGALLAGIHGVEIVELVIVQPRCPHPDGAVRRWRFDSLELIDFAAELAEYAKRTEVSNGKLNEGEWCRFCPAAGICPAINRRALAVAKSEFTSTAISYDKEKLSETLKWLPMLKSFIESVNEFAYNEAIAGRTPPGFKLVGKRATRKWVNPVETTTALSTRFMDSIVRECFTEPELKSVAQVEKLLGKNKDKIVDLYIAESSGTTLVEMSDPRPEFKKLDAKTEFAEFDLFE